MLLRRLLAASALVTSVAAQTSTTHTYRADGRTFTHTLTIFQPPIPIQPDSAMLNQSSAVNDPDCNRKSLCRRQGAHRRR
jgi:hypothetical protein